MNATPTIFKIEQKHNGVACNHELATPEEVDQYIAKFDADANPGDWAYCEDLCVFSKYVPDCLRERLTNPRAEYLAYARRHEQVMLAAIREFHPLYRSKVHKGVITATAAEQACAIVRELIKQDPANIVAVPPLEAYLQYDPETICKIADEVWFGMPESLESRAHPAFPVICDLVEMDYGQEHDE